jgi:hypothetical protein
MRSNQSPIRSLGIQNARKSAKSIVRNGSDRRPTLRSLDALYGFASRQWESLGGALWHAAKTATRVMKTRVTGGACWAVAPQRSGRHAAMCRLAAR